jgi:SAM-dependent methyltransferase
VPLERLDALTVPIPPDALQVQVLGKATTAGSFLYGGLMVAEGLRDVLRVVGRPFDSFTSALDLGCGCGRVLRWLAEAVPRPRLHGGDISAEAIAWDREHLPFARFDVNGPRPPLPHPEGAFDLVVAISVVTHLTESLQLEWLAELRRVLRPGGLLLITAQNEHTAAWKLMPDEMERFQRDGQAYVVVQPGGLHGLPDFYQDAFHSRAYVERVWGGMFALRAYVRHGPVYMQDLVVLERTEGLPERGPYAWFDLPISSIKEPAIAATVTGPALAVTGWAFHPRGGRAPIDVWVDGRRAGEAVADRPTPGVARVYPMWPATRSCGFEATIPLEGLAPGPHRLKITSAASLVGCSATYFFIG